jgi:hypothetical protein
MKPFMLSPKAVPVKTNRLSFDLETFLISPGLQAPPIASLGFKLASDRRKHIVTASDPAFNRLVEEMLSDRALLIHGHHVRFDVACLLAHNPEWAELIFQKFNDDGITCTLIRDCLLRIARANPMHDRIKYDLASAYKLYCPKGRLNVDKQDPNRLRWGQLAGMLVSEIRAAGKQDALDYLDGDVETEDELYLGQEGFVFAHQGRDFDMLADQFRQTRASFLLYLMQCWGVTTDQTQVESLHRQTLAALDEARELCRSAGLVIDDVRNIAAASAYQERAYAKLGLPAPRNEPTDKARSKAHDQALAAALEKGLSEEAARHIAQEMAKALPGNIILDEEACEQSQDPIMMAYSKTSQASLLLGKVTRLRKGIIQASYNTIVNTGRTSCRQGKDPKKGVAPSSFGSQMQNPPREVLAKCVACDGEGKVSGVKCEPCKGEGEVAVPGVRECFIARPGYCIVSIDFDAFEMRTWAQVCLWMVGYSKLAEILNDPARCPHVEMGSMIRGLELALCYQWKKEGDKRIKGVRNLAKGPNFGLPGGMGAERLVAYCWDSYGVTVTLDEAKAIIKVWKTIYPEAQPYLDLIGRMVGERGARTRIIQHISGRVRGGVGYCDASNTFFQGLAADAAKASLWAVACEMYAVKSSPLYGSRPLAFVHDELVAEVPMEGLHERCQRLQTVWCGAAQELVPDVLISASPAASFRWSKSAGDPLFDSKGRIIPFEAGPKYQAMVDIGAALPAPPGQMERWIKIAS